ncbi:hypothetical protein BC940DRAFT_292232 [Gongronella butleri]|nr:hypothetical protein BC940DRAFT_292232 [Gongronella butleri]
MVVSGGHDFLSSGRRDSSNSNNGGNSISHGGDVSDGDVSGAAVRSTQATVSLDLLDDILEATTSSASTKRRLSSDSSVDFYPDKRRRPSFVPQNDADSSENDNLFASDSSSRSSEDDDSDADDDKRSTTAGVPLYDALANGDSSDMSSSSDSVSAHDGTLDAALAMLADSDSDDSETPDEKEETKENEENDTNFVNFMKMETLANTPPSRHRDSAWRMDMDDDDATMDMDKEADESSSSSSDESIDIPVSSRVRENQAPSPMLHDTLSSQGGIATQDQQILSQWSLGSLLDGVSTMSDQETREIDASLPQDEPDQSKDAAEEPMKEATDSEDDENGDESGDNDDNDDDLADDECDAAELRSREKKRRLRRWAKLVHRNLKLKGTKSSRAFAHGELTTRLVRSYNRILLQEFYEHEFCMQHDNVDYEGSYINKVFWSPIEKRRFFNALDRCGKDSSAIQARIGPTKTVYQINDYLQLLDDAAIHHPKKQIRRGSNGLPLEDELDRTHAKEMPDIWLELEEKLSAQIAQTLDLHAFVRDRNYCRPRTLDARAFPSIEGAQEVRIACATLDVDIVCNLANMMSNGQCHPTIEITVLLYRILYQFIKQTIARLYWLQSLSPDKQISRSHIRALMHDAYGIVLSEFPGLDVPTSATSVDATPSTSATISVAPSDAEDPDTDATPATSDDGDDGDASIDENDDSEASDASSESESDHDDDEDDNESSSDSEEVNDDGANVVSDGPTRANRLQQRAEALQLALEQLDEYEVQELIHLIF